MALIHEYNVGVIATPPKFGFGLTAIGGVPNIQDYDATSGIYEPNYATGSPLTIVPEVAAIDPDTPLSTVNGRTLLANIHWYELDDNDNPVEIIISGTNTDYSQLINTEGDEDAGLLQVCKNATPGKPIRLRFSAELVFGSDHFPIVADYSVVCNDVTPAVSCRFDAPSVVIYNPIHDGNILPVQLNVCENNAAADPTHFIPVWEVRREDGSWTEYGYDAATDEGEPTDYWLDIAADGMSAKLDMDLMAEGVNIRVRLKYDRNGNPSSVTLAPNDLSVPFCRMGCVRTLGDYKHKVLNVGNSMKKNTAELVPQVVIEDGRGDIAGDVADKFFRVTIYACPATRALTESDKVAVGRTTRLQTSLRGNANLRIGVKVDEIDPWKAWADADGKILTDADGKILLIR